MTSANRRGTIISISTSRSETTTKLQLDDSEYHVQPSNDPNDPSLFRTNDIRQLSRHDNTISTSRSETTTKLQLDDSEYHMYNLATTRHYSALTTSANCRGTITLSLLHGVKLRQTYS
ncbi:hypothetical protein J6590_045306 [Homalodisca vitripennis]|nr:hypothetical protein J6590_045306 [Homalodisca vitripennis]